MSEIFNFLVNHWQIIASVILIILSFILTLIKKKPIKIVDSYIGILYRSCISAIEYVENLKDGSSSSAKLMKAVDYVIDQFKVYPNFKDRLLISDIISVIEEILETPQKK